MPSNIPGYLQPTTQGLPGGLSLEDFIQTVIVGVSGYTGTLVRPKFQESPPKNPALDVNWIAFSIQEQAQDANAYVSPPSNDGPTGVSTMSRQKEIAVQCSFYGPGARDAVSAFVDGFQIQQNLEALFLADMGFKDASMPVRGPDLVNGRWQDRWEVTVTLVRKVVRTYQILSFVSAQGSVHTVVGNGEQVDQDFVAEEEAP